MEAAAFRAPACILVMVLQESDIQRMGCFSFKKFKRVCVTKTVPPTSDPGILVHLKEFSSVVEPGFRELLYMCRFIISTLNVST